MNYLAEKKEQTKEYWKDLSELIQRLFNDEIGISSIPRLETIFEAIKGFEGHLKIVYVYLNSEERRLLINSLNNLRNRLIFEGSYTDLTEEVLVKVANANSKNQGANQMPIKSIFEVFEGVNDNTLTSQQQHLETRIITSFLTLTFSTIKEDKEYYKLDYIRPERRLFITQPDIT